LALAPSLDWRDLRVGRPYAPVKFEFVNPGANIKIPMYSGYLKSNVNKEEI
jgi:hypothetical protein